MNIVEMTLKENCNEVLQCKSTTIRKNNFKGVMSR